MHVSKAVGMLHRAHQPIPFIPVYARYLTCYIFLFVPGDISTRVPSLRKTNRRTRILNVSFTLTDPKANTDFFVFRSNPVKIFNSVHIKTPMDNNKKVKMTHS